MIKDRVILALFGSCLLLLLITSVIGAITIPNESGPLIIRFDPTSEGADLLGGRGTFFGLLGIIVFLLGLNFVLALDLYQKEKFLSYILSANSLFITLTFILATSAIISIN